MPEPAREEVPERAREDPPVWLEPAPGPHVDELASQLDLAQRTVARLEEDRQAARRRIDELEEVVAAQQRQLVLLERHVEGVEAAETEETESSAGRGGWLDRLLGGSSSRAGVKA